MKQEIITYLSTLKEDLKNISHYLYQYPEQSFCEHKSYDFIVNFLKNKQFEVIENILDIPTSFVAKYGNGHPKICYICEYDSPCTQGHVLGTNLVSTISIGAALGLSKVISKTGGTVILLGCPGEVSNGSLIAMTRQKLLDDIDVVLMARPHTITAQICSSPAILPLKINYCCNKNNGCNEDSIYNAFDACIFTLNVINTLVKGSSKDCSIDLVSIKGSTAPCILSNNVETSFCIKAPNLSTAEKISEKIKSTINISKELMNIDSSMSLCEIPSDNFITNNTLGRIFAHNLKEIGIIDDSKTINIPSRLSLGSLSHSIPCICSYISIVDNENIKYASEHFAEATISDFAQNRVIKTSQALAITGLDLIEKDSLLLECKKEQINKCRV
ncbi:zinc-binding metallopeptidase family protein [Clostridium brassicae]|uniref:Peptidase M20 domain-containing protein 2 n=1 Tax=Clostridium brassicae TaxID=2999072 RepID=A0ABT4DG35_9CLOT|nr:M20 family peptidase [Clostridium brassicae]MCY6960633.1 M20 family peptidase [Clostridium brassicae]